MQNIGGNLMDESDLSTNLVEMKLDEENDVVFEVKISGDVSNKPIYRFVCEGQGISYSFPGKAISADEVQVSIPALQGIIKEGKYNSHLEVIVDNKLFIPLEVSSQFKLSTQVVSEGFRVKTGSHMDKSLVTAEIKKSNAVNSQQNQKKHAGRSLAEVYARNKERKEKGKKASDSSFTSRLKKADASLSRHK